VQLAAVDGDASGATSAASIIIATGQAGLDAANGASPELDRVADQVSLKVAQVRSALSLAIVILACQATTSPVQNVLLEAEHTTSVTHLALLTAHQAVATTTASTIVATASQHAQSRHGTSVLADAATQSAATAGHNASAVNTAGAADLSLGLTDALLAAATLTAGVISATSKTSLQASDTALAVSQNQLALLLASAADQSTATTTAGRVLACRASLAQSVETALALVHALLEADATSGTTDATVATSAAGSRVATSETLLP